MHIFHAAHVNLYVRLGAFDCIAYLIHRYNVDLFLQEGIFLQH